MPTIQAYQLNIEFDRYNWQLFDRMNTKTINPVFEYTRGDNVLYYDADYSSRVGLPGTRMSIDFIRAVLVGYHREQGRWLLGIHLSKDAAEKPVFRTLVTWPRRESTTDVEAVRQAARALAVLLAVPLKVFGQQKLPTESEDKSRSGFTGPLEPHYRRRIDKNEVKLLARDIKLPIEAEGFVVNKGRSGIIIQLTKASPGGTEAPVFKLCEINPKKENVRLIPPTGLLGAFMQSTGHEIAFNRIYNVEFRYVKEEIAHSVPSEDGNFTVEELTVRHTWGTFLTLPDESLLLLQDSFTQSSDLIHSKVTTAGGTKLDTNAIEGMNYFRRHLQEQEEIDSHHHAVEHATYVIASALNVSVVTTEVEM